MDYVTPLTGDAMRVRATPTCPGIWPKIKFDHFLKRSGSFGHSGGLGENGAATDDFHDLWPPPMILKGHAVAHWGIYFPLLSQKWRRPYLVPLAGVRVSPACNSSEQFQ